MKISSSLQFFLNLSKVQSVMNRRFDASLRGLGFSDFVILFHLSQARDEKMRRIDLAEKVGLTASGITRLLAPMEKIGLIKRETDGRDARVSYVVLAKSGKRILEESLDDAEEIATASIPLMGEAKKRDVAEAMMEMAQ
jgi:DNA-binding MarR family transcriptional regulator